MKQRNFVAKHALSVNRSSIHKDRKKAQKLEMRKQKHKGISRTDYSSFLLKKH